MANNSSLQAEKLVVCSICLENMRGRHPRYLMCHHSYCQSCLTSMVQRGRGRTGVSYIVCPECREETPLKHGVEGLPKDFKMESLLDAIGVCSTEDACYFCHKAEKIVPGTKHCNTCDRHLCDPCSNKHSSLPIFASHKVVPLTAKEKVRGCLTHGEPLSYICNGCSPPVELCDVCVMSEDHSEHAHLITDYKSGKEKEHKDLRLLCDQLLKTKVALQSKAGKFAKVEKAVQECARIVKERIDAEVARMMNNLQTHPTRQRLSNVCKDITNAVNKASQESTLKGMLLVKEDLLHLASAANSELDRCVAPHFLPRSSSLSIGRLIDKPIGELQAFNENTEKGYEIEKEVESGNHKIPFCNVRLEKIREIVVKYIRGCYDIAVLTDGSVVVPLAERVSLLKIDTHGGVSELSLMIPVGYVCTGSVCTYRDHIYIGLVRAYEYHIIKIQQTALLKNLPHLMGEVIALPCDHEPVSFCVQAGDAVTFLHEDVYRYVRGSKQALYIAGGFKKATHITFSEDDDISETKEKDDAKTSGTESTSSGRLFISDQERGICCLSTDGILAGSIGSADWRSGQLSVPSQTAILKTGHVCVGNMGSGSISVFSRQGLFLQRVPAAKDGFAGPASLGYCHPYLWSLSIGEDSILLKLFKII